MAGMEATVGAMEATMVATESTTTARGPLRLRLMLSPPPLLSPLLMPSPDISVVTDMDTVLTDTDTLLTPMDIIIMARGLLMPSPDISVVTDMDTVLTDTEAMAMGATEDTTMARGLLMPSPATGTTAMGTEATVEDTMVMVMVTGTDTTVEKFQKFMLIQSD